MGLVQPVTITNYCQSPTWSLYTYCCHQTKHQMKLAPRTIYLLTRNDTWDVLHNNRLAEDSAVKDVPDCTIGALPHLLQLELC